jgi:hypothetical protein
MQIKANHRDAFTFRHNSPMANDTVVMLKTIGVASLDQLIEETIPFGLFLFWASLSLLLVFGFESELDLDRPRALSYIFSVN